MVAIVVGVGVVVVVVYSSMINVVWAVESLDLDMTISVFVSFLGF